MTDLAARCDVARSVCRDVAHSACLIVVRSVCRSVVRSVCRSATRSVGRRICPMSGTVVRRTRRIVSPNDCMQRPCRPHTSCDPARSVHSGHAKVQAPLSTACLSNSPDRTHLTVGNDTPLYGGGWWPKSSVKTVWRQVESLENEARMEEVAKSFWPAAQAKIQSTRKMPFTRSGPLGPEIVGCEVLFQRVSCSQSLRSRSVRSIFMTIPALRK